MREELLRSVKSKVKLKRTGILLLIGFLLLTNCAEPVAKREQKGISRGVYATKDSIDVSRYDLAKNYINETTRLVPPPATKDRVKITPFVTPGKKPSKGNTGEPPTQFVVLPPNEQDKHVIVMNSPEYNQLLTQYASLQKSQAAEKATFDKIKKDNDEIIKAQAEELARLRARPNIFVRTWHFITALFKWGPIGFVALSVIGVVVAILVPGLAPFIWATFRMVGAILGMILGLLTKAIVGIVNLFKKK